MTKTIAKKSKKAKLPKVDARDELLSAYTTYIGMLENNLKIMESNCAYNKFLETSPSPTIH